MITPTDWISAKNVTNVSVAYGMSVCALNSLDNAVCWGINLSKTND